MADQIIPNTDSKDVACLAIAWEIVRLSTIDERYANYQAMRLGITKDVIEVYQALVNCHPIGEEDSE